MSYVKTNWQNDQAPAINATNLNKIEQGIYDNDINISGINETLGVDTNTWVGTTAYGEGDIVIYNDKIYQNITGTSTTTNPAEDTTNWDETSIFDTDSINDDLIDKTKFIKNTNTNSDVDTYSCNYLNNNFKPVELYYNANGTTGNITLSESTTNYTYIDIYFGKSSDNSRVQRFYDCNGNAKTLYTVGNFATTGVVLQELFKRIEFNGTTITSPYGFYRNTSVDGSFSCVKENEVKIYKIIGYK